LLQFSVHLLLLPLKLLHPLDENELSLVVVFVKTFDVVDVSVHFVLFFREILQIGPIEDRVFSELFLRRSVIELTIMGFMAGWFMK
jgi:hypothetical protein